MSVKITVQAEDTFELALLIGTRANYVDGPTKEFYPALELQVVQLPNTVIYPSTFVLKNETSLPSIAQAKARAAELLASEIRQAITDMLLETYAFEP